MNDCVTICQYKTDRPTNIEISTPISLVVQLFWKETCLLSVDPK